MSLIDKYIAYISDIRRFSVRTQAIYADALTSFMKYTGDECEQELSDNTILKMMTTDMIRNYEMYLIETRELASSTVNLHISAISGFCRFLMKQNLLTANPANQVIRPKLKKRLPVFYKHEHMKAYLNDTAVFAYAPVPICPEEFISLYLQSRKNPGYSEQRDMRLKHIESLCDNPNLFNKWLYDKKLHRLIVSILYSTGIRRAELVSLKYSNINFDRGILKVLGKGQKEREIPLISELCKEISLYLQAVDTTVCETRGYDSPLLMTYRGKKLYPAYIDRAVKSELGENKNFTARKSPHVLRHTLATELLNEGADMNSIKELLGHSSLAATQVYTHNSIAKLKKVYETAHPRAQSGGKHGD